MRSHSEEDWDWDDAASGRDSSLFVEWCCGSPALSLCQVEGCAVEGRGHCALGVKQRPGEAEYAGMSCDFEDAGACQAARVVVKSLP